MTLSKAAQPLAQQVLRCKSGAVISPAFERGDNPRAIIFSH
jgi:hypothetical protein